MDGGLQILQVFYDTSGCNFLIYGTVHHHYLGRTTKSGEECNLNNTMLQSGVGLRSKISGYAKQIFFYILYGKNKSKKHFEKNAKKKFPAKK